VFFFPPFFPFFFFLEKKRGEVVVLDTSDQVVENKSKSGRICNSVQIRPLQVVY